MKKSLYILLVIIALSLLYVRIRYGVAPAPSPSTSSSTPPSSTPTPIQDSGLSESLSNVYFSIDYSPLATTSSTTNPDSRSWTISYMGEEQKATGRTQTELWDGYIVNITRFEVTGDNPDQVQAKADRQGTIDACGEENVTPLKSGIIGKYETITYFGGCLGEADQHYLMMADVLYRVTIMTVGSDKAKSRYQAMTQAMINTLNFK